MSKPDKITYFFKQQKTSEKNNDISTNPEIVKNSCKEFYDSCLQEKDEECQLKSCAVEKLRLVSSLDMHKQKLERIRQNKNVCSRIIKQKEAIISKMKLEIDKEVISVPNSKLSTTIHTSSESEKSPTIQRNTLFSKYSSVFDVKDLAGINSIGDGKSNDSTFVLNVIRSLYRANPDRVGSITVSGISRSAEPKQKMTPEKHEIVKGMYDERLVALNLEEADHSQRKKKLAVHMKNAFINIVKTKIGKNIDDETIQQINEKFNANV